MKGHDLLEAIGGIEDRYIQRARIPFAKRRIPVRGIVLAAACALLLALGGLYVLGRLHPAGEGGRVIEAEGLVIPAIALPSSSSDAVSDMKGLILYQGRIYTSQGMDRLNSQDTAPLRGDYIGRAKGNLDEWSDQEDYAIELASTVSGEVYTVKGYDPTFRIGIFSTDDGDERVEFFDCLNGITLTLGRDLFEDRLHMSRGIEAMACQSRADYDLGLMNRKGLSVDDKAVKDFVKALYEGEWIAKREVASVYLLVTLKDGTELRLGLCEGGYAVYQGLGNACLKIPEDVFDPFYQACLSEAWDRGN